MTTSPIEAGSSFERVLDALRNGGHRHTVKSRSRHIQASCPLHEDRDPSLSIDYISGERRTFLHCQSCRDDAVVDALGLTFAQLHDDWLPEEQYREKRAQERKHQPKPPGTVSRRTPSTARKAGNRLGPLPKRIIPAEQVEPDEVLEDWHEAAVYEYSTVKGEVTSEAVRRERAVRYGEQTRREKSFVQRYADNKGGWINRKPEGFSPTLFLLPEVAAAITAKARIWVCEGEKDARAFVERGEVATTNAGGATNFSEEHADQLAGADEVIVVTDRDRAGYDRAVTVCHLLDGKVGTIRIAVPAVDFLHADASDHFDAGHGLDDFGACTVDQARAEALVFAAEANASEIHKHFAEAEAQLKVAEEKSTAGAPKAAEDARRFAGRWAVEAGRWLLRVVEAHDELGTLGAVTAPVRGRMDKAAEAARRLALQAYIATGIEPTEAVQVALTGPDEVDEADAGDARRAENVTDGPWPGSGEDRQQPRISKLQSKYSVHEGELVAWRTSKSGDLYPEPLLNLVVKIERVELREADLAGDDHLSDTAKAQRVPTLRDITHYVVSYPDPETGMRVRWRVRADEMRDSSWLENLPLAGLLFNRGKRAGERIWEAINATNTQYPIETIYSSTGWRKTADGQWKFVHASGLLGAEGNKPATIDLTGPLARYELTEPVSNDDLRELWTIGGLEMLHRLPDFVAVPLIGAAYRAVVTPNNSTLGLFGVPGTFKTAVATLAMHHYGTRWENTTPVVSMSGTGATMNGFRNLFASTRDVLVPLDDVAPDGGITAAEQRLASINRMFFNREGRTTETRDKERRWSAGPAGSAMITSEVRAFTASGDQRWFVVELLNGDVDLDHIIQLDRPDARYARNALMSTFVAWLARDLEAHRQALQVKVSEFTSELRSQGSANRVARGAAELLGGWDLLLGWLVEQDVTTREQADALAERVMAAIVHAARRQEDPDSPTSDGGKVRMALAEALRSGIIHLTTPDGGEPPSPQALRLGYRQIKIGTDRDDLEPLYRLETKGKPAGAWAINEYDEERLYLRPDAALAAVQEVIKASGSSMPLNKRIMGRALESIPGCLRPDDEKNPTGTSRLTRRRMLPGGLARVWDLKADVVFSVDGDSPDDATPSSPTPGPDPSGPSDASPLPPATSTGPDNTTKGEPAAADAGQPDLLDAAATEPTETTTESKGDQPMMAIAYTAPDGTQHERRTAAEPQLCGDCDMPTTSVIDDEFVHTSCFDDRFAAAPVPAQPDAATSGPVITKLSEVQPCVVCTVPASHAVDGNPVHLIDCIDKIPAGKPVEPTPAPVQDTLIDDTGTADETQAGATPVTAPAVSKELVRVNGQAPAAVIDVDGIHLPDGSVQQLPWPLTHAGQLVTLATELGLGWRTKGRFDIPQVWLTNEMCEQLGLMVTDLPDIPRDRDQALTKAAKGLDWFAGAEAEGWDIKPRQIAGWTTVRRDNIALRVVLLPYVDPSKCAMVKGDPDPSSLARRLYGYAKEVGIPFRITPAITSLDLMTATRPKPRDDRKTGRKITGLEIAIEPVGPSLQMGVEPELHWTRTLLPEEAEMGYVMSYDRNGQYLSAASSTWLGSDQPAIHLPDSSAITFDQKLAGYWRITPPEESWTLPSLQDPTGDGRFRRDTVTVATPTMTWLLEAGHDVQIHEAWVWETSHRYLELWYKRLREARTSVLGRLDDPDANAVYKELKATWTHGIGNLAPQSKRPVRGKQNHDPMYRPDWRHQVIAMAKANLLRQIIKIFNATGRWPFAITVDALYYTATSPDPKTAWPGEDKQLGKGLGQFEPERAGRMTDALRELTDRSQDDKKAYRHILDELPDHLVDVDEWKP
ncbi:hypothetical protein ACFV9C_42400 [Kribbella sp. NPDC059898]|uniref:hypothetical protein n=1 Tax=Kribbella sp. NPDC059898 TaxID=3346995 RepID=UPI00364B11F2